MCPRRPVSGLPHPPRTPGREPEACDLGRPWAWAFGTEGWGSGRLRGLGRRAKATSGAWSPPTLCPRAAAGPPIGDETGGGGGLFTGSRGCMGDPRERPGREAGGGSTWGADRRGRESRERPGPGRLFRGLWDWLASGGGRGRAGRAPGHGAVVPAQDPLTRAGPPRRPGPWPRRRARPPLSGPDPPSPRVVGPRRRRRRRRRRRPPSP